MSEIRYVPPAAASGPTGSGAAGQVTFWSAATVLTGSNNLFWNNTNARLGIGTNNPQDKLDVNGAIRFRANTSNFSAVTDNGVIDYVPTSIFATNPQVRIAAVGTGGVAAGIKFIVGLSTSPIDAMYINGNGNVLINTTTDLGAKLGIIASGSTSATKSIQVNNSGGTRLLQLNDDGGLYIGVYMFGNAFIFDTINGQMTIGSSSSPAASSLIDMRSTTRGFLPPRMTDAQILAISSPAAGLMAYSTTQSVLAFYDGTGWRKVNHSPL